MPEINNANIELHLHTIYSFYLAHVLNAMERTCTDVVAVEELDNSVFSKIVKQVTKNLNSTKYILDKSGVTLLSYSDNNSNIITSPKTILNAREYNTKLAGESLEKERLHIITVGAVMDNATPDTDTRKVIDYALQNGGLVILDHPFVDNRKTKTAGHVSEEFESKLVDLCKKYSGQIALEWNGYCIPWTREGLKLGLSPFFDIKYHDVNKRAEKLSDLLKNAGYNIPVLADTDLHAREPSHLDLMGCQG